MAEINLDSQGGYWGSAADNIPKGNLPAASVTSQTSAAPMQDNAAAGNPLNELHGYYSQFLGRPGTDQEVSNWLSGTGGDLSKAMHDIANSPEALAYAQSNYGAQGKTIAGLPQQPAAAPSPYGGTNVFNDPATANFEQLLNGMINQFATPKTPPDYQQAVDQLNKYLAQLNGPTYTPEQMGMLQTQALDPINQQHDAARQQTLQRLASQGITPSSGIAQQALQQVDQAYEQMRTQTQNQFATNAINLSRQNAATAASLAPQISQFEYNNMTAQDPRNLQAVNLAAMIPQMAMQRLGAAQGSLMNPAGIAPLLTLLGGFQQTGYNQGANYGSGIAQLLAALFGMG